MEPGPTRVFAPGADPGSDLRGVVYVPDHFSAGTSRAGFSGPSGVRAEVHIVENGRYLYRKGQEISKADVARLGIVDGRPTVDMKAPPKVVKTVEGVPPDVVVDTPKEVSDGTVSEASGTRKQSGVRRKRGEVAGQRRNRPESPSKALAEEKVEDDEE